MIATIEARTDRLLRWYPAAWRDRYGEEFAALLTAEIEEQPQSWRRTADVVVSGLTARLSLAGIGSGPITEPLTAFATIGCMVAACFVLGLSVWSQLVTGVATGANGTSAHLGLLGLTASLAYLAILALAAVVPLLRPALRAARTRSAVRRPLAVMAVSAATLLIGGVHLGAHWLGGHGAMTDRIAGFGWAETWAVNTAWAHPTALPLMHPARLAWMLISPVAVVTCMAAAAIVVRRLELSARTIRYGARLTKAASIGMAPMVLAAAGWVLTSQHAANASLRAGTLDLALIVVMATALAVALRASRAFVNRLG